MAEEYWPPNSCDCKTYSKSPQKTKQVWDRVKKLCRAKNRRDLEIQRLKLRAQQKIKAGKKPEALVILREMKRLKDMKLTDYIAEKESAKLARAGANSGGRRRRRTRRRRRGRTRRRRRRGSGKAPKQRDRLKKARDWERRKKTAKNKIKKQKMKEAMGTMIGPGAPRGVAAPGTLVGAWGAPAAAARADAAAVNDLGGAFGGLQMAPTAAQQQADLLRMRASLNALSTKGGRRRTRRRRGGQPPPKVTVGKIEADVEAEWKRRQNLMIARAAAEKSANDIQQILKKAAQEEVEAAAKRQS